jgi:hypothetical protein
LEKKDDHRVIDLQLPESVLLKAREMAKYVGVSLEEFIVSAIGEKLAEDEEMPPGNPPQAVKLRNEAT